jgi:hypothetical protein
LQDGETKHKDFADIVRIHPGTPSDRTISSSHNLFCVKKVLVAFGGLQWLAQTIESCLDNGKRRPFDSSAILDAGRKAILNGTIFGGSPMEDQTILFG